MQIVLDHITPTPLVGVFSADTEVWDKKVELTPGQSYLVLAPSGTGKSTLLLSIYGIRKDYTGQVLLDNKSTSNFGLDEWANVRQTGLSIVFQDLRLFPHLTAMENIMLKADLTKDCDEKEVKRMAESLGVGKLLDRESGTLSYGEQQRMAIIRSLSQPFKWLLLDEPFSHLDDANIAKGWELMQQKAAENNAGIIMSSLGDDYGFQFDNRLTM